MTRGFRDEGFRRSADDDDDDEAVTLPDVASIDETPDAVQCVIPGRGKPVWIPKSQITDDSEVFADDQSGKLIVTRWLAEREGFE